jgi:serine/threonine protein kinase
MSHPWDKHWEEDHPLRPGGQGITRLVKHKEDSGRQGVLKYLKNNKSMQARARMRREVASLQSLAALNGKVPRVLEDNSGSYEDSSVELYLVMEFIDGPTLKEFVEKNGALGIDRAAHFALALCGTMKIAHAESILHRDIKPDNIIVRDADKDDLYLVDYGLSFNKDDSDLTQTAEQFKNKFLDLPETNTPSGSNRDPRSDITAVCGVFYYMLTKHAPGHLQDGSGKMPHLRPGFSLRDSLKDDTRVTQVELILSRGLAPQLQNRFQTIDELSERLTTLLQQAGQQTAADPIARAAELSLHLKERDRKTQLAECRPIANELMNQFIKRVNSIGKELKSFKAGMVRVGLDVPKPNLEVVSEPCSVTLEVEHHGAQRQRIYLVGARGEQCVVVACTRSIPKRHEQAQFGEWQEVAWYQGQPGDAIDILTNEFKQWLDKNIEEVFNEILAG